MKRIEMRFSLNRVCNVWVGQKVLWDATLGPGSEVWKKDPVFSAPSIAFIIADASLKLHIQILERVLLMRGWRVTVLPIQVSEATKSLRTADTLHGQLLKHGADRSAIIFALGGGVVGDLAGFVASTYMRGVRWVGVPTTLLAQVDSALGGKVGVNHAGAKNLIGGFFQPSSVLCDLMLLKSLPPREVLSGLGEVLKYALLSDREFCAWIQKNWSALLELEPSILEEVVHRCLKMKAKTVLADEYESLGRRIFLNLGHTVGHALEVATDYRKFRHGEAVIHGLRAVVELSAARGVLAGPDLRLLRNLLEKTDVPPIPRSISARQIAKLTFRDKKKVGGKRRFILLKAIGKPVVDETVTNQELIEVLCSMGYRK